MKKLLALGIFGLLIASQAHAQTPAPSAPPAAPAAAQPACAGTDKASMRKCQQQQIRDARKALEQKIAETCKKQGVKGAEMVACRLDMLAKATAAIN